MAGAALSTTWARNANVGLSVVKRISGHKTNRMVEHYSTISGAEQRASISEVVSLFDRRVA